ncbi:uncharacterized protein LOC109831081 [Asparagus officinalis]|uniref:uncharacterized protein LOC109831081 n=1 Tax=Asparagus officinalis TaxID=4686 RepID=UPI00098E2D01|nr:uncharacterized protein LOC109831081 [Asparagus officinalis]
MIGRKALWNDLLAYKQNVNCPWVIGGDFNAIISSDEKIGGAPISQADTEDFQNFISSSQLTHIRSTGCFFIWCNKQEADSRIWSRLDRCLVNEEWIHNYTSSQVEFLMPSCSDHSPALLTIGDDEIAGKRPFKFFNMWTKHSEFISTISSVWEQELYGYEMYKFHTKLKRLKPVLKVLNKNHFMNISEQVDRAKSELANIQGLLNEDLFNPVLISKEKDCLNKYVRLMDCETSFYRQRANIKWGLYGDKSS